MHLDPEQLRIFTALMAEGSAARASLELRTSRSNVRRIWQKLEDQLGAPLFLPESGGALDPTPAARRLDREMVGLLDEVRRFESTVRKIHRDGRILRLGAGREIFGTGHFGRAFHMLRSDSGLRVSFVEVGEADARSALESGACDLYFSADGVPGRRVESRDLPPMPLEVACPVTREGSEPVHPQDLCRWSWSLAALAGVPRAKEALRSIRKCGGGEGSLCTQHHFLRWAESPLPGGMQAVVCVRPVAHQRLSRVTFLPLLVDASYPLNVSYLKQHPYEFLPTVVDRMDLTLSPPTDGLRSGQS